MIKRYLISSPGRMGSHIVTGVIRSAHGIALHTHNPFLKIDNDASTALIMVSRRDFFSAIMSNCLTWRTNQFTSYPITSIEHFEIDRQEVIDMYQRQKWYYMSHDFTRHWGLVETFYFEDFVNDHNVILNKLGLTQDLTQLKKPEIARLFGVPAPYHYRDIVINHEQCREWYEYCELNNQPCPWLESDLSFGLKEFNETWE